MLNKDTIMNFSLGTLIAVTMYLGVGSWKVFGYVTQLHATTKAVQDIGLSMEISRIDRQIGNLEKERRDLQRDIRKDPDNDLLLDQLGELNDSIRRQERLRECVIDPYKKVCE